MENDDPVVRGQAKVALDSRPGLQRGREGEEAVFWKFEAVMQAAVGKACRSRVKRVGGYRPRT